VSRTVVAPPGSSRTAKDSAVVLNDVGRGIVGRDNGARRAASTARSETDVGVTPSRFIADSSGRALMRRLSERAIEEEVGSRFPEIFHSVTHLVTLGRRLSTRVLL
jgi:hypothetical protein